jgi:hypothetical protein
VQRHSLRADGAARSSAPSRRQLDTSRRGALGDTPTYMSMVKDLVSARSKLQVQDPPGAQADRFWAGVWHGLLLPLSFLICLFNPGVPICEANNREPWYDSSWARMEHWAEALLHGSGASSPEIVRLIK